MSRRIFRSKSAARESRLSPRNVLFAAPLVAWIAGFLHFTYTLPGTPDDLPKADAIVALTGGAERIGVAMKLLADGKGGRLLISGVHEGTGAEDLKKRVGGDPSGLFSCCVDLDRAARNTAGNAIETARWVRAKGYKSVIIVTAQYHMPRSMIELGHALPDVALIAYPVHPQSVRAGDWWRSPATAKVLAFEFTKCLIARMRLTLEGWLDSREAA